MVKTSRRFLPLFVLLFSFSFAFNATVVSALTQDQINAIISLVRSFGVDESIVKNVDDSLNGRTPTIVTEVMPEQSFCYNWSKDLTVGSGGSDVKALNDALSKEDISDRMLSQASYFDENTAGHIVRLQAKYGIRQTGYVGPVTRAKLNQLYGCGHRIITPPPPHDVVIPINVGSNVPVISGVSGPQTLGVNQEGTWTIKASSANGGNLSYSVVWGDENVYPSVTSHAMRNVYSQQSATFSHSYLQAGTYTPTFTVTSQNTIACITTPCPSNGGSTKTSLSVRVGDVTHSPSVTVTYPQAGYSLENGFKGAGRIGFIKWVTSSSIGNNTVSINLTDPSGNIVIKHLAGGVANTGSYEWRYDSSIPSGKYQIQVFVDSVKGGFGEGGFSGVFSIESNSSVSPAITVLRPNGGETWTKGTTQTIKWQDNRPVPVSSCSDDGSVCTTSVRTYDLKLAPYYPPCTGQVCPMYAYREPYPIAKGVYGSSYEWSVGKASNTEAGFAPDGAYTIQVCQSGTNTCDFSDSYFKITSDSSANHAPKIITSSSLSGDIKPGQTVNFSWTASDPDNDDLSWSINWGENSTEVSSCSTVRSQNGKGQTYTASHAWAQAGTYQVKVTVSDCVGGSDSSVFTVVVGNVVNPSLPTVSLSASSGGRTVYSSDSPSSNGDPVGGMLTVNVGDVVSYKWSTNGSSATSNYTVSGGGEPCNWYPASSGPLFPWVANTTSGSYPSSSYQLATISSCQAGHTYKMSYKGMNSSGSNTAEVTVVVNSQTTQAPTVDTCRLDFTNGTNITRDAIGIESSCLARICDVYGPANAARGTASQCVFSGKIIKHYPAITSVQPSITVLSPNGGESWQAGSTQTLRWNSSNVSRVSLDLYNPNTGALLFKNLVNVAGNPGSVNWTIPSHLQPGQYWLRVGTCLNPSVDCNTSGAIDPVSMNGVYDGSDSYFTITSPTVTTSVTPVISSLSSYAGSVGTTVTVSGTGFSSDSSIYFGSITVTPTNVSATSMTFTVPSTNVGYYYVSTKSGNNFSNHDKLFNVTASTTTQ
ncbi:MAG: PKD domain-containing protein [bacterium]|nr:PKD domain-containing protein [bacterium]